MMEIIEYAELEGIHQNQPVQLLALHRTPQQISNNVPESVIQTLLELRQAPD